MTLTELDALKRHHIDAMTRMQLAPDSGKPLGIGTASGDCEEADMHAKTPGHLAYDADCLAQPTYHDGSPRRKWDQLGDAERWSWERNPTPRGHTNLYAVDGLCHNAEPGTFSHECGKRAEWIGVKHNGFASGYCSHCKAHGFEAAQCVSWERIVR